MQQFLSAKIEMRQQELITKGFDLMTVSNFLTIVLVTIRLTDSYSQNERPTKQEVLNKFGFTQHTIIKDKDTIWFYVHKKENSKPANLVLYLQGTSPDPLFTVENNNGKYTSYRWFPGDYKFLDDNYYYAIIGKTGVPPISYGELKDYSKYHQSNSLQNRVLQADLVIKYISKKLIKDADRIIVYGHSEGAPVAAKLGTVNKNITHLGFWAGNALPDYFDFLLQNSKANWTKQLSDEDTYKNVKEILASFQKIAESKDDVSANGKNDYSARRWWSYAEPPINNLLKINVPVFVQVAGKDESAPIESTYLIPLEFTRLGKRNLRFEICIECNHGFDIERENGEIENKWDSIFQEFIRWTILTKN